jgi:hypothetical protein
MPQARNAGFMRSRWCGEAALGTLFWRDMLLVGTFINLLTGFVALMLVAQGAAHWLAATVHFACVPYNAFLVLALWRTPGGIQPMRWASLAWLGLVTVI